MARTWLSEEDSRLVAEAVAAAEANSAGEIVTIVTDRSDGYMDVALAWSLIVAFLALAVYSTFPGFVLGKIDWLLGSWRIEWTLREVLTIALGLAVVKFAAMMLLQLIQPLKFWLIPPPIKSARVNERAVEYFRVGAERRTTGLTGILIYLSMREHRAEIVADEAIASQVEPEVWGKAMEAMLGHIKDGRVGHGLAAAIGEVGKVLAAHVPRQADDVNELPDRPIEI
jgi:putative membrane protein